MNTAIAFILIFGALVFFHELGHLYFAKRAGILCREFAIGFGPKIFSFEKNETVYTIRLLPLGGYVRMAGEDADTVELKAGKKVGLVLNEKDEVAKLVFDGYEKYPNVRVIEVEQADLEHNLTISGYEEYEEELQTFRVNEKARIITAGEEIQIAPYNRQFGSKKLGQRALTIFAGPAMNFILAFVIFVILGFVQGVPVDKPMVGKIMENSAAEQAGLKENDTIQAIDGKNTSTWKDVVTVVRENPNKEITLQVKRDNEQFNVKVTPTLDKEGKDEVGRIGVYSPVEKTVMGSIKSGFEQTYQWTKLIFDSLVKLVTGQFSINELSGPVGIYNLTDQVVDYGFTRVLSLAAVLSINLGLFNLLPVPALDGGRLFFFLIEALRGKPIDRQKEGMVHFIGFALLMLLMLVVTWNDIRKFFL
ncbi:RIP metalloprotease RseP [Bacillus sp. CH126_4D]|uniref:RIP metalloprotease RseP n=1 Tax=unclassified Bacillus (in: firmicutes) TaxID=185979 RepID=UPI00124EF9F9|nr:MULTISPECIES: RIP metalloprotease RseP [unclassified Bacillus (in: firmicutes)]KAB2456960.1 RIP metalloprotease RseP [Bacillus sp. CH140a_4T]KAB2470686.1 RIP metalloprotease RseP [Bacillus sp. CH126_4D]